MPADAKADHTPASEDWSGEFGTAENRLLDASLAATPAQRLKWVEEALAFAMKMGAINPPFTKKERAAEAALSLHVSD